MSADTERTERKYLWSMKTHIILLRGVTPTGKNKVLMAPLRAALENAGLQVAKFLAPGYSPDKV
jgi:hypothetical protein